MKRCKQEGRGENSSNKDRRSEGGERGRRCLREREREAPPAPSCRLAVDTRSMLAPQKLRRFQDCRTQNPLGHLAAGSSPTWELQVCRWRGCRVYLPVWLVSSGSLAGVGGCSVFLDCSRFQGISMTTGISCCLDDEQAGNLWLTWNGEQNVWSLLDVSAAQDETLEGRRRSAAPCWESSNDEKRVQKSISNGSAAKSPFIDRIQPALTLLFECCMQISTHRNQAKWHWSDFVCLVMWQWRSVGLRVV